MASTIRMYDSGVTFVMTVKDESGPVNLTTVKNVDLFMQKPDKSVISRPCTVTTPVTGGVRYVSQSTDFDQAGRWSMQLVVKFADNNIRRSGVGSLLVEKNLSF